MGYARVRRRPGVRFLAAPTAVIAVCAMAGCGIAGPGAGRGLEHITILSYNVQNLFDATADGSEYPEFDPARGGWTAEAAEAKAARIARVIRRADRGGPDVLCLQEVEHGRVVAELARDHLRWAGYRYAAASETPGSAVEVALLSRLPIAAVRVHAPVHSRLRTGVTLRPVLEVRLETAGAPLYLFVNHWKSKSGGARETEPARRAAASVVARRMRSIEAAEPGAEIVVCGDLNESPRAFDEAGRAYPTALMPLGGGNTDSSRRPALRALRVSGSRAAVRAAAAGGAAAAGEAVLYSPWGETDASGSYYFRGGWHRLDHTLVSAGLLDPEGWELASFEVVRPRFATTEDGRPIASRRPGGGGGFGEGGYSDHLPVMLTLKRRAE
ncbi:MAG: endonuclease/exonuclease/phosphatase family protein [Spirochaetaceae bacterium]